MTMTYVFPDLHGRLDHFTKAIAAIEADGLDEGDTIVFLGDYIDRGPHSAQLVRALRAMVELRPNTIALSGNHEFMMIWGLTEGDQQLTGWIANGGGATLASYSANGDLDEEAMKSDALWFNDLPVVHVDDHRAYVHAGFEGDGPWHEMTIQTLHWKRYKDHETQGWQGKHVVHGHDAHADGPKTFGDRTAMDVGAVWHGRYVVGVFDDSKPGGPVRVIEVHG